MTSAKKLVCGHLFHVHCLRSWLERQNTCPTCRALVVPAENATSTASGNRGPHQESLQQGIGLAIHTYFWLYWTLCSQSYLSLKVLGMENDICASDCPEDESFKVFFNMRLMMLHASYRNRYFKFWWSGFFCFCCCQWEYEQARG